MSTQVVAAESAAALVPPRPANPLDLPHTDFRDALTRRGENRHALIEWVRSSLVEGVDYGSVPLRRGGFSKPSLRKPGAEKICGMLGVTASFPTLKDYEGAVIEGRPIQQIVLRCHLLGPDGQIVADGVGARSVEQDHGDVNKALKMAAKSAHIDATLRMAGLSEIFTQDIEDMPQGALEGDSPAAAPPLPNAKAGASSRHHADRLATERQVRLIRVKLDQARIPESQFLERFGIPDVAALPFTRVNEALDWICGVAA
jgi:hypothetical protein